MNPVETRRVDISRDAYDLVLRITDEIQKTLLSDAVERVRLSTRADDEPIVTNVEILQSVSEDRLHDLILRIREPLHEFSTQAGRPK